MGTKGDKLTPNSAEATRGLVERLAGLGDVSTRRMFGGFGVFESAVMFCIVDSGGVVFFRADDETTPIFEDAGGQKHDHMPYYSVPDRILTDAEKFNEWGQAAVNASKRAKKK